MGSITWGIVRGESIHLDCATEQEIMLTWAGFHSAEDPRAKGMCRRCGRPLSETPQP